MSLREQVEVKEETGLFFCFPFCFLFGTKTGNIMREFKGMENKLHKEPNDLDR